MISNQQLTKDEAIRLYETKWWASRNYHSIAAFQLSQNRLCCPFDIFHEAVEKALCRPVFTHEFGLNRDGLIKELAGNIPRQNLQDVLSLLPQDKTAHIIFDKKT